MLMKCGNSIKGNKKLIVLLHCRHHLFILNLTDQSNLENEI